MASPKNSIVLLAKKGGMTSFSALWQIKDALETKKVGHTGTLDTFADGLLVAASGSLTRICQLITDCDKEYLAKIVFGQETDTLDPDGSVVNHANLPILSDIHKALTSFTGTILQQPPVYSALHVNGKRASDLARQGVEVVLKNRPVSIYSLHLINAFDPNGAYPETGDLVSSIIISVHCSKGTYIRSLARDIAHEVHSCAYVEFLRRTRIGPFQLKDAAGADELPEFASCFHTHTDSGSRPPRIDKSCILEHSLCFTPDLAKAFGYESLSLKAPFLKDFCSGKTISMNWFESISSINTDTSVCMVFYVDNFIGAVRTNCDKLMYEFVAGDTLCT